PARRRRVEADTAKARASTMIDGLQFNSLAEFLAMGGYAFNVWSVYALFALFLTANLLLPWRRHRRILREQRRRIEAGFEAGASDREEPAAGAGWEISQAGSD
ncbi:MAG: heme exporter protein CcmD, partial [Gammaproteobacteria bacterium]|nr:heme exporter protein CcmD [Gammaproteobacteria bacterium]